MYLDLFTIGNTIKDSFDIGGIITLLIDSRLPDQQFVVSGSYPRLSRVAADFFTLRWLDPFILIATVRFH